MLVWRVKGLNKEGKYEKTHFNGAEKAKYYTNENLLPFFSDLQRSFVNGSAGQSFFHWRQTTNGHTIFILAKQFPQSRPVCNPYFRIKNMFWGLYAYPSFWMFLRKKASLFIHLFIHTRRVHMAGPVLGSGLLHDEWVSTIFLGWRWHWRQ